MKKNKTMLIITISVMLVLIFGGFLAKNYLKRDKTPIDLALQPAIQSGSRNIAIDDDIRKELMTLKNKTITLNQDHLDEIKKQNSFDSKNPDVMFYILKYVETRDSSYCNKIDFEDIQLKDRVINYCKNIFKEGKLNEALISNFVKQESLSEDTLRLYMNIVTHSKNCENIMSDIHQYTLCKIYFNKDFDVQNTIIGFERIISGNQSFIKSHLGYFMQGLGLENDAKGVVLNFLR